MQLLGLISLADQYKKQAAATICMFGDGATNIGYFHEAVNMAKVWKLPVLWVCENNGYGMGTSIERASAVSEIRQKAEGYGMKNCVVDGMDVIAVHDIAALMLEEIRAGKGPQFLEIETYRFRGHSMGDPEKYRKAAEVHHWQENDPIGIYQRYLVSKNISSDDELEGQTLLAETEVEEAVEFAEISPEPGEEELFRHIYVED